MEPDNLTILLGAALLAWGLRCATGRQPLADALEWPARRLARAGPKAGEWATIVAAILSGAVLGSIFAASIPLLDELCSMLLPARPGAWNTAWSAVVMLGAVRVPPARECSRERLARAFVTPWLLLVVLGPWAAYGYRSAAAASAEGLDTPLIPGRLRLCDALSLILLRPMARVTRRRSTASGGVASAFGSGPGNRREWSVEAPASATLTHQAFYFPGWQAWVDGRRVSTGASAGGMVTWQVPLGRHQVRVGFVDTPVCTWAWWVSGLSLLTLAACSRYPRRPGAMDRMSERRLAGATHPTEGASMLVMPLPTIRKPTRS